MPAEHNWPRPYLLKLYARACEEGCIRVDLKYDEERFRSLKAAFYRCRRRKDGNFLAVMKPEYQMVTMRWEPAKGTALIIYDKLPDSEELPDIVSVDDSEKT